MIIQRILRQSSKFSHLSSSNQVNMVDISNKKFQKRTARAQCYLKISSEISQELKKLSNPDKSSVQSASIITKGDVFTTAKLAGIQAAKMTSNLIPLCHPINLTHVDVEIEHVKTENFNFNKNLLKIQSKCTANYATGVEMEALMACNVAALTIYDMVKAVDSKSVVQDLKLIEKIKD